MIKAYFGALAFLAVGCAPTSPTGVPAAIPELAGRTAGPAETCVPIESTASMHLAGQSIIYSSGSKIWLNTTNCPARYDDILVLHPTGSQHCRGDIVGTADRYSHIPGPSCVLGDFIPYLRNTR